MNLDLDFDEFAKEILESKEIKRKKRWLIYLEQRWKYEAKKKEEEEQTAMLILLWLFSLMTEANDAQHFFTLSRRTQSRDRQDPDLLNPLRLAVCKRAFGLDATMSATLYHHADGTPANSFKPTENLHKAIFFAPDEVVLTPNEIAKLAPQQVHTEIEPPMSKSDDEELLMTPFHERSELLSQRQKPKH